MSNYPVDANFDDKFDSCVQNRIEIDAVFFSKIGIMQALFWSYFPV